MTKSAQDEPNDQNANPASYLGPDDSGEWSREAYRAVMAERDALSIRHSEMKALNVEKQRALEELKRANKRALKKEPERRDHSHEVRQASEYTQKLIKSSARWRLGNFLINLVQVPAQNVSRLLKREP